MNETELAELERGIREALADAGLDWVLADIEEGIKAKGRVDVVVPRSREAEDMVFLPGVLHECDVVVLDADEAALCRRRRVNPRASKCLLAIECKYYASDLELGLACRFVGHSIDLGNRVHPMFVANVASDSVTKYLTGRKLRRELNVVPGAPEIDDVQHLIREAFKAHVGKGDPSYRI